MILKEILYKRIPKKLLHRPKQGFSVPINKWLHGPLNEWMFDSLNSHDLKRTNVFNISKIESLINDFNKNKNSQHTQLIWNIINLQKWLISNNLSL